MKLTQPINELSRRNFIRTSGLAATGLAILPSFVFGFGKSNFSPDEKVIFNPTPHSFNNEPVRLKIPFPQSSKAFVVKKDGEEFPYQVEENNGIKQIWVVGDFAPGASHQFEVIPETPKSFPKKYQFVKNPASLYLKTKTFQ
jgi:hypothetical protein